MGRLVAQLREQQAEAAKLDAAIAANLKELGYGAWKGAKRHQSLRPDHTAIMLIRGQKVS
jgi:hypothetical protein